MPRRAPSCTVLTADDTVVGHIWLARRELLPGEHAAYVYDVEVAEPYRGRGHGRTLMLLGERIAHTSGESLIALHVFAGNAPARGLYESLGYRTTHINLRQAAALDRRAQPAGRSGGPRSPRSGPAAPPGSCRRRAARRR